MDPHLGRLLLGHITLESPGAIQDLSASNNFSYFSVMLVIS